MVSEPNYLDILKNSIMVTTPISTPCLNDIHSIAIPHADHLASSYFSSLISLPSVNLNISIKLDNNCFFHLKRTIPINDNFLGPR